MTREQAELIIKEERLIQTEWNEYGEAGGEYYFIIWFNPNNNKYETIYIGERGVLRMNMPLIMKEKQSIKCCK